jgi:hypothetical protein
VGVISMQVFSMVDVVEPDLDCRSLALEVVVKPILLVITLSPKFGISLSPLHGMSSGTPSLD